MYPGKDYHEYLEIRNQLGETPCDVAMLLNGEDSKHVETVRFLWERGAAVTPETESCMLILKETRKRDEIIKKSRDVLNERIRVAENQADIGWKLLQLDDSTRGTIFENLVHNNDNNNNNIFTNDDRATSAMMKSKYNLSITRIQSIVRSFLNRRRFCRYLEKKRNARYREAEQLKRLAERSPRSWRSGRTPDGKKYYYDIQTGCRAWRIPEAIKVMGSENKDNQDRDHDQKNVEEEEKRVEVVHFKRFTSPPGLARFRRPRDHDRVKRLKRCMTKILLSMSSRDIERKSWYFIDGASTRHGPYETEKMAGWLFHPKQHVALNAAGPYAAVHDLFDGDKTESKKVSFEWDVQSELRQADMLIRGHLSTIGEEMGDI